LLKPPSNLALNTAREGAATASLGKKLCIKLTAQHLQPLHLVGGGFRERRRSRRSIRAVSHYSFANYN